MELWRKIKPTRETEREREQEESRRRYTEKNDAEYFVYVFFLVLDANSSKPVIT